MTPFSGVAAAMQVIELGAPLAMFVVPSIGSSAMSNCGAPGQPHPELFALENTGRVVLDPFADHDFAADVHQVEHPANRIAGRSVGFFFFATAKPGKRVERGRFRRADEIELNDPLDVVVILLWNPHPLRFANGRAQR